MTPTFGNGDFSGGLNVRELGHNIAPNEATLLEGVNIHAKSLHTHDGDIRILIDAVTYPEVLDTCSAPIPGTGGGVDNGEPILGMWRYYYHDGSAGYNAWVRVHGHIAEYWPEGGAGWIQIGNANWPLFAVPNAVQFRDNMYLFHGTLASKHMGKYLFYSGNDWHAGDIPIPGFKYYTAIVFTGVGLNDMTTGGVFTGNESINFRVEVERNPIGPVIFYGGGLNDMTTGGAYVGADIRTYLVEIDTVGANDTFRWSDDGGGIWTAGVVITGAAQALSNGVTITFAAITGHTLGEYWGFECGPTDGYRWSADDGVTWAESGLGMIAGVAVGLQEGATITFAADAGHTIGDFWTFTAHNDDLPNLRPSFAVTYKNRLYAVSVENEPYTLRFSGVNRPTEWRPPEGGYVRTERDAGDPITGLFVHQDSILIFRRHSVWRYYIDDYGYEHIGRIHGAAGCLAHRTICAYKDAVYYASDEGMIALYGADSDCVTHKIGRFILPDPDYIKYMSACVNAYTGTLWVTYLRAFEEDGERDACGDLMHDLCGDIINPFLRFETDLWRADIRRPNMLTPRWTLMPYYRCTCFATPPQSNCYYGGDNQNLRFCAQQPDVSVWNSNPANLPDPLYPTAAEGGPRHYCYRMGAGYDRDQVPAYDDACGDLLYAGDVGIGYWMSYKSPRYLPAGSMIDLQFEDVRLDYFRYGVWGVGMDGAYGRVWIDEDLLTPDYANALPTLGLPATWPTSWWPINGNTPGFVLGGMAHTEWRLHSQNPSNGKSLQMEFNCWGTADRSVSSGSVEFRFFAVNYKSLRDEDKLNPEV